MDPKPISIFDYVEYRKFLQDFYDYHKEHTQGFSHRTLSAKIGFASPNFFKLVMDGKRNISREAATKIAAGLGLSKKESEYFSYLVFFAQANSSVDRNYYFGLIASLRAKKNITSVREDQHQYFSAWYNPLIRELVKGKTDPLDFEELSKCTGKLVSAVKIRKCVLLLLKLDLIRLSETGVYMHSAPLLNTDNELKNFAIRKYHREVLGLASRSLDEVAPEKREVSHLTLRISPSGFAKIKKRLQDLREELLQVAQTDENPEDVYHVNFQMYPVATVGTNENK